MHANMLLLNGKKMSKSDGNNIMPSELFSGNSPVLSRGYSPMAVRFFMLQSHYRSTLDLTDEALQAAEKGYKRLLEARRILESFPESGLTEGGALDIELLDLLQNTFDDLNDDFNAPKALARLFELASKINALKDGQLLLKNVSDKALAILKKYYNDLIFNILGLKDELTEGGQGEANTLAGVMSLVLDMRATARTNKDWTTSDKIRNALNAVGIKIKDSKEGSTWEKE
jgi:cysteinyl-tRNA synthetase